MNFGAFLVVIVGLSTVQCLPSAIQGRQEAEAEAEAEAGAAVSAAVAAAASVAADVDVNVNVNKDAHGQGQPEHPKVHLNLVSAIGHIISPLVRGILEPLCVNVMYGVVGGIINTLKHPESVVQDYDHPEHHEHHEHGVHPAKFPDYRSAPGSEVLTSLLKGFDAYVMQVPGAGKYLFISSDRNLGASASQSENEADKNYGHNDYGYEEIPFSANPLLNSIFGTIRIRSGPIPDKKVENYVKQQLGADPESAAESE